MSSNMAIKFYCFIFNKMYFDCIIRKNGIKVGELVQMEPNNIKGGDFTLISQKFKMSWYKPISPTHFHPSTKAEASERILRESSSIIYSDGNRFVCVLDVESAIPLYESIDTSQDTICNDLIVTTIEEKHLKLDKEKLSKIKSSKGKNPDGVPVRLKTLDIIPTMLFELTNAYFVTLTMKQPKGKFEELVPVLLLAIIVFGFLVWYMMSTGTISKLA